MQGKYLTPLGVFLLLVILFIAGLGLNPKEVPSPFVGQPAPDFSAPALNAADAAVSRADLQKAPVSLFNVWASWCTACRQEHPFLMELSRRGDVPIYGLNYKDERPAALAWLHRFGDPYVTSAFDQEGQIGIEWGVYGVPETFVVDRQGMVLYKHIGPLTPQVWEERIMPVIRQQTEGSR